MSDSSVPPTDPWAAEAPNPWSGKPDPWAAPAGASPDAWGAPAAANPHPWGAPADANSDPWGGTGVEEVPSPLDAGADSVTH